MVIAPKLTRLQSRITSHPAFLPALKGNSHAYTQCSQRIDFSCGYAEWGDSSSPE
jgi:hypothetical protein